MPKEIDDCTPMGSIEGLKHKPISRVSVSYRAADKRLILHQDSDYVIIDEQQAAMLIPMLSGYLKNVTGL